MRGARAVLLPRAHRSCVKARKLACTCTDARGRDGWARAELESGTEFDTKLCGKGFGSEVNPLTPKCYGPGGFVKDIWAADKYREGIEDLIENDCALGTENAAMSRHLDARPALGLVCG